ncbi:MAG: carboxypeptidase regulatory-like domain-containing protein [Rhodanobacteraceae bacterium]|nr:carboxypeptidase regulatory-like domain-containing protein [Rhodanobacteraceae bacterium]
MRTSTTIVVWLAVLAAAAAQAGTLRGKVSDTAGRPIDGAIVTLTDARGVGQSVYTDKAGAYSLTSRSAGAFDLRVRKRYHADHIARVELGGSAQRAMPLTLTPLADAKALSEDHPSLSHFMRIPFDKDPKAPLSRENFSRDCLTCHQLGNAATRMPRPPEGWLPSVQRMHGYLVNKDEALMKRRSELLAKAFDGTPVTSRPVVPTDAKLKGARLLHWRLDGSNVPHDAHVHQKSGKVYTVDMFAGKVIETDLASGKSSTYEEPAQGMPPGGAFGKAGVPAPYGLTVPRAPHSLSEDSRGLLYLTDSIGASIGIFNPATKSFQHFDVGSGAVYPHTVRVDRQDVVWATMAFSNQVARFDPKTKDMKVLKLPATATEGMSCCQVPYGIDVNPKDGSVWYTKLFSNKIGRIDAKTLQITEYDSPVTGPRRQRFDKAGNLWVAGFSDGAIARISVADWKAKIYKLPVFASGEISAPYSLGVHPKTQEIWVNDTMMDVAWRFLPQTEQFVAYPLPLKGTYTRDFSFTKEGWACTSNNPIPPTALEGGVPELICIDAGR